MPFVGFDGIHAKVESPTGVETNMTKTSRGFAMDGLTSANFQKAIGRVAPPQATMQKGLTAANLQAGLGTRPTPTPPPPAPSTSGTSSPSGSK